jgi:two-component system, NarL family, sensor kinase
VASLAIFAAVGFGLFQVVSDHVVKRELEAARFRGEFVGESLLRLGLDQQDLTFLAPFTGPRYEEMLRFVHRRVLHYPVLHVRLWVSNGQIVFADTRSLVGRYRVLDKGITATFRQWRPVTEIEDNDPLDPSGPVVESNVPLFLNGSGGIPVAVAQVVQDYGSVQNAKGQALRGLLPALGLGLAAIYVLLLPTVWRLGRVLHRRNTELSEALQREREGSAERQRLLDKILTVSEEERTKMAADLHDGPVQRLASVSLAAHRLHQKLRRGDIDGAHRIADEMAAGISEQVEGLRAMMADLRPPALQSLGLREALRDCVELAEREGNLECELECEIDAPISPEVETVLYRVSQESLTNVVKHSGARHATVRVHTVNGQVRLEVADDGRGFVSVRREGKPGDHFGLLAMRERVTGAGGTWELESRPGQGTRIVATVPREPERTADGG